jgi:hypothetical protein
MPKSVADQKWRVRVRGVDYEWVGRLEAVWEVSLDPISDNYTPDEIGAEELLSIWGRQVQSEYPNGLAPIYWYAACRSEGKFAAMPFQFNHFSDEPEENFLTIFTWPIGAVTGERLNWFDIPVVDKLWNNQYAEKGGFIQEATGWKPSILQPYVYLPSLLKGTGSVR